MKPRKITVRPRKRNRKIEQPILPSKEDLAVNDMFDSTNIETEVVAEDKGETSYYSAMGEIDTSETLALWKERGLLYRESFINIIIDTLAAVNALSDIENHFKNEKIDPAADYLTEQIANEFSAVVGDRLVSELISNLYSKDPEAGKRVHAHVLALRTLKGPSKELASLKRFLKDSDKGEESPYGNLGVKRGYGNEE